jgi:phosphate transport system substrate-binding protein
MRERHHVLAVGLIVASALAVSVSSGCSYSEEGKESEKPAATTNIRSIGAAGSTFIAPLMTRWSSSYAQAHPVQVNYRPIGSGAGIEEMKKGFLEFGASDAPLNDDQVKQIAPVVQVPVSAGPVCIIYNVPGLSAPLRLSGRTLAGIFRGDIISWQDPSIARDNPGVKLPHAAVIVVHRSDGSGTTSILTNYLSSVDKSWAANPGAGLSVKWPVGIGADGSKGVVDIVKQAPGSVGYLELNYAKENGLPTASIQNQAGEFLAASPASTAAAISAFSEALAKDVRTPIVNPPATARDAYPICGLTFVLVRKDSTDAGEQQAVRDFIAYTISAGQDSAEEMSYAKLPDSVQKQGQQELSQLTVNGQPLK